MPPSAAPPPPQQGFLSRLAATCLCASADRNLGAAEPEETANVPPRAGCATSRATTVEAGKGCTPPAPPRPRAPSREPKGALKVDGDTFFDAESVSTRSLSYLSRSISGSIGKLGSAGGDAVSGAFSGAARTLSAPFVSVDQGGKTHLHVPGERQAKRFAAVATRLMMGETDEHKARVRARMASREAAGVEALREAAIARGALPSGADLQVDTWHSHPLWHALRRFLRARKGDVAAACDMFCEHAAWRCDFRTDDILRWFNDEFHEKDAVRDVYPSFYLRQDRMGRPVYVERLGRLDIKKLTKLTSIDRLVKYHVFEYEALVRHHFPYLQSLRPENDRWDDKSTQSLTIIDLKGVSLSSFRAEARDYLSCITKIDSCNYPELLGNLMVINTPFFFRGVWAVVKPMLDPATLKKIHIYGSDYTKKLHAIVRPEDLPPFLGGSDASLSHGVCMSDTYLPKPSWRMSPEERAEAAAKRAVIMAEAARDPSAVGEANGRTDGRSLPAGPNNDGISVRAEAVDSIAEGADMVTASAMAGLPPAVGGEEGEDEDEDEEDEWHDVSLSEPAFDEIATTAQRSPVSSPPDSPKQYATWSQFRKIATAPFEPLARLGIHNRSASTEPATQQERTEEAIAAIEDRVAHSTAAKPHRELIGQVRVMHDIIKHGMQQTEAV